MADNKDIQIPSRLQIFNKLIIKFDQEYQTLLKAQDYSTDEKIELTEHLLNLLVPSAMLRTILREARRS